MPTCFEETCSIRIVALEMNPKALSSQRERRKSEMVVRKIGLHGLVFSFLFFFFFIGTWLQYHRHSLYPEKAETELDEASTAGSKLTKFSSVGKFAADWIARKHAH